MSSATALVSSAEDSAIAVRSIVTLRSVGAAAIADYSCSMAASLSSTAATAGPDASGDAEPGKQCDGAEARGES
jgi:hypothetical protein